MMTKRWKAGDIFLAPNSDGKFTVGQVLAHEKRTLNCASCAFFDCRVDSIQDGMLVIPSIDECISTLLVTPDGLDGKVWPVIGNQPVLIPRKLYPYEKLLASKKLGAKVRGSGNVASFLDAYYCLRPWDDWFKADYLDDYLLSPDKKPKRLILVKTG